MIIGNTYFRQHPRRLWTWKSPGNEVQNQTDYILISKRFRNGLKSAKTRPGADCDSDHALLTGKIKIKMKRTKKATRNIQLDLALLKDDDILKERDMLSQLKKKQKNPI